MRFALTIVMGLKMYFKSLSREVVSSDMEVLTTVGQSISISELLSALSALTEALESINQGVEPRFIEVGESLQSVYSQAAGLEREVAGVASTINRDNSASFLCVTGDLAARSVSTLQTNQEEIADRLANVGTIAAELRELRSHSTVLERIARQLRVVSVQFAVEVSRTCDSTTSFTAFTKELRRLADNVSELSESIADDSSASEKRQRAAYTLLTDGWAKLNRLTSEAERALRAAIENIDRMCGMSVKALDSIAGHSGVVSKCISSMVTSIQFHDITRQQVEHIVQAVRDVEAECKDGQDEAQSDLVLGRTHTMLRLQRAQLEHVISMIRDAHDSLESSFNQVGRESTDIASSLSQLARGEQDSSVDNDTFEGLRRTLKSLLSLLGSGRDLGVQTGNVALQAAETSAQLSLYLAKVRTINYDLKLKALNAIVKSISLDEQGRSLSVLAGEVMRLSKDCDDHVVSMVQGIESILGLSEGSRSGQISESGEEDPAGALASGIDDMDQCYAGLVQSSKTARGRAEDMGETIEQIEQGLVFLLELIEDLSGCTSEFDTVIEMLEPWARTGADAAGDLAGRHAQRYTMDKEREIHLTALGLFPEEVDSMDEQSTGRDDTLPGAEANDSEFGDNIELF